MLNTHFCGFNKPMGMALREDRLAVATALEIWEYDNLPAVAETSDPSEFLKDPYVLEFLGLPDRLVPHESELEQALIDDLQRFLLELGRGFSFVGRQQRFRINRGPQVSLFLRRIDRFGHRRRICIQHLSG